MVKNHKNNEPNNMDNNDTEEDVLEKPKLENIKEELLSELEPDSNDEKESKSEKLVI